MGLITFNGQLLAEGGALANTKDCCCGGRNCYCFTQTVNYVVVARWRKCYRVAVFDTELGVFIFPDGQPCDGLENGQICPPGTPGRIVTFIGAVSTCSCLAPGDGNSFQTALITSQGAFDDCVSFGSPP